MGINQKKTEQLGMPQGTAANRLRKSIIFMFLVESCKNVCHQCGAEIKSEDELSIEHKIPWLNSDDPKTLFFDLSNIAFSHFKCNVRAARKTREIKHPSWYAYQKGCRCDDCKAENALMRRKQRMKIKT